VIGLFFVYAALSIFWSDFPFITLKHWIKGIGDVMMVMIVLTEPSVVGAVRALITRITFVFMPLSVLFIKYYPVLGRRLTNSWTLEPVGVATQKNSLGELCDIFGIGLVWYFRRVYKDRKDPYRRRRLLALGVILTMNIWLLWMCNSTTSICALGMASAVMLASTRPTFRRRPALITLVIGVVLGFTASALLLPSLGGAALLQGLGKDSTLTGRTDTWPIILSIPNNSLVGAGYESFWIGPRLQKLWDLIPGFRINEAHNGYIEVFLNLGWIGVFFLGLLLLTGYRNVLGAYAVDPDIGSLRIALFLAPVIHGLTEAAFRMMGPPWTILLLATTSAQWTPQRCVSPGFTSNRYPLQSGQELDPID
jgi:O-antigen ligase